MTTPAPAPVPPHALPLDPDSPQGREAADAVSDFAAEVIARLRREGKPVPGATTGPP